MIAIIFVFSCIIFTAGYFFYGKKVQHWFGMEINQVTPATELNDGIDYVPTPSPILFGHHFSSIAGAGPIVGPILAAYWFGWGPALIWILVGAIFIGAVHDYTALMASVRHKGMSLAEIGRKFFSTPTYYIMLSFIWLALIYLLTVFLDLTALSFAPDLTGVEDAAVRAGIARSGGVVATSSIIYIIIAIIFGLLVNRLRVSYKKAALIFVPMVFIGIWLGSLFPLLPEMIPHLNGEAKNTWLIILLAYCFLAAITPVWLLLQPRDFLSSFLLYACLITGGLGLLISSGRGDISISFPFFKGWMHKDVGFIFPVLFITVACGAVSGFHSLVASGTTAKQLNNEKNALSVAYGAMLIEGVLAVIAVVAVMLMKKSDPLANPVAIFANAIGRFGESIGLSYNVGMNFGKLAISTFLLTTLDTCTRLARFILDEMIPGHFSSKRVISTALTLVLPAIICFIRINDVPAWEAIWPAFGATNQLMAAIALLVVSIWLIDQGRAVIYVIIPTVFMIITAGTALLLLAKQRLLETTPPDYLIGILCTIMFVMVIYLIFDTMLHLRRRIMKPKSPVTE